MSQLNLFKITAPVEKPKRTETCGTCKYRQSYEYDSSGIIHQYCKVRKSNRTINGLLKIKCKNEACLMYKKF